MAISIKKINEAHDILNDYEGENPYIQQLKRSIITSNGVMNDFVTEYILNNCDFKPEPLNKIIKISDWFGEKLKEKYFLDFIPTKLLVGYVIGKMGDSLHCYVKYKRSQEHAALIYLPNKAMLDDVYEEDFNKIDINFDVYDKITEKCNRKLKEHQKTAIKFLISKEKCILADDQGLGKTTELVVASLAGDFKKILIVCPASLKSTWNREIKYYVDDSNITIVNGSKWKEDVKYTILNFDILKNFYEIPEEYDEETGKMVKSRKKAVIQTAMENSQLFQSKFDLVIIDECHKLSNSTSNRYKIINDFLKRTSPRGIVCATGTPITNRPMNFYNILKLINADITKDWEYYVKRYCDGRKIHNKKLNKDIWITSGSSNLNELREKVKHLYIRRLKKDIPGMVDRSIETLYYDLSDIQQKEYDNLWKEYLEAQYFEGSDVSKYQSLIEGTILRQYISKQMMLNTIKLTEDHLEDGEKVMIVCAYDDEVYGFKEHFGDSAVIYNGKMTIKQKDKSENEFMNNPKVKVFIGQIIAAGVGLTLTAGNICIFNSYDWIPGNNLQIMDRVYRIGQTKDVTVYYQLFSNTISEEMFEKVIRKELIIDSVIKDEITKEELK